MYQFSYISSYLNISANRRVTFFDNVHLFSSVHTIIRDFFVVYFYNVFFFAFVCVLYVENK